MKSIAGGLAIMQKDMVRKAALGWYDVLPFISRVPWRPQRIGTRDKANGKKRVVVNASWPENYTSVYANRVRDDMGVAVFSLNSRSRMSYDEARGTDSSRMHRFACRLRSTAGSPPPPDGDVVIMDSEQTSAGSRVAHTGRSGRVTVANASSAPVHPHPVYCGRGTLFGNPLCMDCEEQRDDACAGFRSLLRDSSLSPYAVAAQLGLRCHPVQARVVPAHRYSLVLVLAHRVAAGRSLQLVCHCSPRRCHCEAIAEMIDEISGLLYSHARTIPPHMRHMPLVLHLFGGPSGREDGGMARTLLERGMFEVSIDTLTGHDLCDDGVYMWLRKMAMSGAFAYAVAGIPCSTHSRARHRPSTPIPGRYAARPLRDRQRGGAPLPWLTSAEVGYVRKSDMLTRRSCAILWYVWARGGGYIIENPPDYAVGEWADLWGPIYDHSPLWIAPPIVQLEGATAAEKSDFDQCPFGSQYRKPTTIMYAPGLDGLRSMQYIRCLCLTKHAKQAVGYTDEYGTAAESAYAAAYPLGLNEHFADVARSFVFGPRRSWKLGRLSIAVARLREDDEEPKRPGEVKVMSSEYMYEDSYLKYVARLSGTSVVTLDDDFADWFYQIRLAASSVWMVGLVLLELEKLATEMPQLRYLVERVLGQGTVPGSNLGQRLCELVLHMWDFVFAVLAHGIVDGMRRACQALDDHLLQRAVAGLSTCLHARGGYTDDCRLRFVGPTLARAGAKAWFFVTKGFRVLMADETKRQLGVHDVCLGVCYRSVSRHAR
uniref:DUF4326 domain-containing protein n=1 Tax=Prymnesium polylepis TaxID=72548 RepID=A0A7S4JZ92_9EUKA